MKSRGDGGRNSSILSIFALISFFAVRLHSSSGSYTCPKGAGWQVRKGYCYKYNSTYVDWHTARDLCRKMDSTLLTIKSKEEMDYVKQIVRYGSWIGLHDIKTEDKFVWIDDGQEANYTNWYAGEPNNAAENCVYMYYSYGRRKGTWNDGYCRAINGYVCKKPAGAAGCETGLHQLHAYCYNISRNRCSWQEARRRCQAAGNDLVTVMDEAENTFLKGKILTNSWIGLNDIKQEGRFRWLDQTTEATYENWYQGEPNNAGNVEEDCVEMLQEYYRRGKWNDVYCGLNNAYICEKARETNRCDDGWRSFQDHCYKQFSTGKSWFAARKACQEFNADLVTTNSLAEHNFVKGMVVLKRTWLGLHDKKEENRFVWLDTNTTPNRTYWNYREPNSGIKGRPDCVMTNAGVHNKGKWNNVKCNLLYPYVCEMKPASGENCSSNWFTFSGSCYRYHADKASWTLARTRCKRINATADLVKIESTEEQDYINTFVRSNAWIGLHMKRDVFIWLNETTATSWANWDFGYPNHGYEEDCAEMKSYSGQWGDAACSLKKRFTCKVRAGGDLSYFDFRFNNSVYKVLSVKLARNDADKLCGDLLGVNASLIQIEDAQELANIVPELNMRSFVSSRYIKPSFWIAGDPRDNTTYRRWASRYEPVPGRSCMTLNSLQYSYNGPTSKDNYRMYSKSCCDQHMAICEKFVDNEMELEGKNYNFIYENSLYKILPKQSVKIEKGVELCRSTLGQTADLISFRDEDELKFVSREMRIRHLGNVYDYWVSIDPDDSAYAAKIFKDKSSNASDDKCLVIAHTTDPNSIKLNEVFQMVPASCSSEHSVICKRTLPDTQVITNTTDAPTAGNFSGQTGTKVIYKYKAADYSGCKGTCLGLAVAFPFVVFGVAVVAVWVTLYLRKRPSIGFSFHKSTDQPYVEFMGDDPAKS